MATKKRTIGCVLQTFVLAFPFSLLFIIKADARFLVLRRGEIAGSLKAHGQRSVQLSDELPIGVGQSDVEDDASQLLVGEAGRDVGSISDGQSGVGLVAQLDWDKNNTHRLAIRRAQVDC